MKTKVAILMLSLLMSCTTEKKTDKELPKKNVEVLLDSVVDNEYEQECHS
jgi:hypothetical protein